MMLCLDIYISTLNSALEQGNLAIGAIIDYSSVTKMLAHVRDLSNETDLILQRIMYQSSFLSENLDLSVVNLSNHLLYISLGQSSDVQEVLASIDSTVMLQSRALSKIARLNNTAIQLASDVMIHKEATNLAVFEINETLVDITNQLNEIHEASFEILSNSSSLLSATPHILANINTTLSVSH